MMAVLFVDREDLNDIGVIQLGDGFRLGLEALQRRAVRRQFRAKHFHGDFALEGGLLGQVNLAHAAAADAAKNLKLAHATPGPILIGFRLV